MESDHEKMQMAINIASKAASEGSMATLTSAMFAIKQMAVAPTVESVLHGSIAALSLDGLMDVSDKNIKAMIDTAQVRAAIGLRMLAKHVGDQGPYVLIDEKAFVIELKQIDDDLKKIREADDEEYMTEFEILKEKYFGP